jgi:hypothetical protein
LKYERDQGQEELAEGLDVGEDLKEKFLDQIEFVFYDFDSDHTFCNEKMSMARGTRYRREREQTSPT